MWRSKNKNIHWKSKNEVNTYPAHGSEISWSMANNLHMTILQHLPSPSDHNHKHDLWCTPLHLETKIHPIPSPWVDRSACMEKKLASYERHIKPWNFVSTTSISNAGGQPASKISFCFSKFCFIGQQFAGRWEWFSSMGLYTCSVLVVWGRDLLYCFMILYHFFWRHRWREGSLRTPA